jgi:hypothetical protein
MKSQNGAENEFVPIWERNLSRVLEVLILLSGLIQTFGGERSVGILILLSFLAITFPEIWSRGKIKFFPIEVKILLFIMVVLQLILGEIHDFYTSIP